MECAGWSRSQLSTQISSSKWKLLSPILDATYWHITSRHFIHYHSRTLTHPYPHTGDALLTSLHVAKQVGICDPDRRTLTLVGKQAHDLTATSINVMQGRTTGAHKSGTAVMCRIALHLNDPLPSEGLSEINSNLLAHDRIE